VRGRGRGSKGGVERGGNGGPGARGAGAGHGLQGFKGDAEEGALALKSAHGRRRQTQ